MSEEETDLAYEAARLFAATAKRIAAGYRMSRAAAFTRAERAGDGGARVITPNSLAPNAYPIQYGLRHPLNYPNQVHAKHAKSWGRWMARTPRHRYMTEAGADPATVDRALTILRDKTIEAHWDKDEW